MSKIRIDKFLQSSSNAFAENRLLKICLVLIVGLTIVNTIQIRGAIGRERTVIMPTGVGYAFEISGNTANDEYFKQMARYVINLYGSIDASNVHAKFNELLMMVHPTRHGALRDELLAREKDFLRYASVAQHLSLKENEALRIQNNNKMVVRVIKESIVGSEITRRAEVDYMIEFVMEHGRFWLMDIKEKPINA
ncbi:MAG: TraE/TraK family type IV conjugative transfer system protein [Gammaproteobacteria bacterium]